MPPQPSDLKSRVIKAAEAALAHHQYVSPLDVLVGMSLLTPNTVESWKKGRVNHLEPHIQGNPDKLASAFKIFAQWIADKGLLPTEVRYTRPTRNGSAELNVTHDGNPETERFFRTHYLSPMLTEKKQKEVLDKQSRPVDPVVFEIVKDSKCSECGVELWRGSWLFMDGDQPLCLACANLAELEYLPAGDAALTRRAVKYSHRKAVVVRFARTRGHYERQGILVEPAAIEQAELECLEDADQRAAARAEGVIKRGKDDEALMSVMIERIAQQYPGCPTKEVREIAVHAAKRGSGRVGRTAAGKVLDEGALRAAVTAAVRQNHTNYDELLSRGVDRFEARERVIGKVEAVLAGWQK